MSPRDRLVTALAPELVAALEELVAERVLSELARLETSDPQWLTLEQADGHWRVTAKSSLVVQTARHAEDPAVLAATDSAHRATIWWVEQAAERLGCSRDAVRMRANRGRLETRNHGRRVYVSAASVASLA